MATTKRARANLEFQMVEAEVEGGLGEKHCEWLSHLRQYVGNVGLVEG